MRKIAIYILALQALFVLMSGCGGSSGSGRKQGEIYGECFKDNTCNEGLVCDTDYNTCIRDEDDSGDAGPDDDEDYDDAEAVSEDADEPEEDDAIYEETLPEDVSCWEYRCKDGKSYCGYKENNKINGEIKWAKIETCAFSECIASTGKCGCDSSEDGEIHCENKNLRICSNGKWQIREMCQAGCDSATDWCKPLVDHDSGLEWSVESNAMIWEDAVNYCDKLTEGGYSDWRLPSISEVRTLIKACHGTRTGDRCGVTDSCLSIDCLDYNCSLCEPKSDGYYSKIDINHTSWNLFWSASEVSGSVARAWGIELYTGSIAEKFKNEYGVFRCVRGENHRQLCEGLPEHAFWNTTSNIFSTWDGSSWQPSLTGVYNETSSEKECRFKCIPGYKWDGYKCVSSDDLPECGPESPAPCKDYSSGLVWSSASWNKNNWKSAVDYCFREDVGRMWFIPTIDELRTLVKKCPKAEYGGICAISEENGFLSIYDVGERETCMCNNKDSESSEYNKFGDSGFFWSSSASSDNPDSVVWGVFTGPVSYGAGRYNGVEIVNVVKTYEYGHVRCVAR